MVDNLDTQINSQNGLKATHGMVMIHIQAGKPTPGPVDDTSAIPAIMRLKQEEPNSHLQKLDICGIMRI